MAAFRISCGEAVWKQSHSHHGSWHLVDGCSRSVGKRWGKSWSNQSTRILTAIVDRSCNLLSVNPLKSTECWVSLHKKQIAWPNRLWTGLMCLNAESCDSILSLRSICLISALCSPWQALKSGPIAMKQRRRHWTRTFSNAEAVKGGTNVQEVSLSFCQTSDRSLPPVCNQDWAFCCMPHRAVMLLQIACAEWKPLGISNREGLHLLGYGPFLLSINANHHSWIGVCQLQSGIPTWFDLASKMPAHVLLVLSVQMYRSLIRRLKRLWHVPVLMIWERGHVASNSRTPLDAMSRVTSLRRFHSSRSIPTKEIFHLSCCSKRSADVRRPKTLTWNCSMRCGVQSAQRGNSPVFISDENMFCS